MLFAWQPLCKVWNEKDNYSMKRQKKKDTFNFFLKVYTEAFQNEVKLSSIV